MEVKAISLLTDSVRLNSDIHLSLLAYLVSFLEGMF